MTLIRRIVSKKTLIELDAFSKVDEVYKEFTTAGATVSIFSYIIMVILIFYEITYYMDSKFDFRFKVDTDYSSKLKINVDLTIAMPCSMIGADVIDSTNMNNAHTYGMLQEDEISFQLTPEQQHQWDSVRDANSYLRDVHHSVRDFLWKVGTSVLPENNTRIIPASESRMDMEADACRIHGSLTVNKVAGNFHVTIGKHIPLPIGHAHVSLGFDNRKHNFSHRIEKFSFGENLYSIINPLEGEEKITTKENYLYHYYIKVISTNVQTRKIKLRTYQYSATEKEREINHMTGSHGMPGIYFKYEIDPIAVTVNEISIPLWKLFIRIAAIIAGVFATSGLINTIVDGLVNLITCKYLNDIRLKNFNHHHHPNNISHLNSQQSDYNDLNLDKNSQLKT